MAIGEPRAGELRVPLRVADSYVRPGDESRLFPTNPHFLSRDEIFEVFPKGFITHERFQHEGYWWRLVKRAGAQGSPPVYLAVMDSPLANGGAASHSSTTGCVTPDSARLERLRSMPLDGFSAADAGEVSSSCSEITLGSGGQPNGGCFHHAASMPAALLQQSGPPSHRSNGGVTLPPLPIGSAGNSMRDRHNNMAIVSAHNSGSMSLPSGSYSLASGFMTDLIAATESPMPLDRYKAFVRLFSTLCRMRAGMGLPAKLAPFGPNDPATDCSWDRPEAQELVSQMIKVGECLAKFGTADFVDGRNNSSRAITTKDYAMLLRMYLEDNGAAFLDGFIARLPLPLQDEALSVRGLLQTRCETNDVLFNQLVKSVGHEPAGGGAMVFNTSTVSANPTNHMLAAPKTLVNTVSNAWAKADVKRRAQFGALGAVAVVALWVLKRKLFGGGGGGGGSDRRRRGDSRDESEWGGGSSRRISHFHGGGDQLAARLMDERKSAERMAVRYISACQDELRRAQQNDALLRNDWRLGPVRLAPLGSGPVPAGYEPIHRDYCSVSSYMNSLDGGMPLVPPTYTFPDRLLLSGGGGGMPLALPAPRESASGGGASATVTVIE